MGRVKFLMALVVLISLVGCVTSVSQAAQSVEEATSVIGDAKDLELAFKSYREEVLEDLYVVLDIIEASCKRNPTKREDRVLYDFVGRIKNSGNFSYTEIDIIVTFYRNNEKLGKDLIVEHLRVSIRPGDTKVFGGTAMVKGYPTKAVIEFRKSEKWGI